MAKAFWRRLSGVGILLLAPSLVGCSGTSGTVTAPAPNTGDIGIPGGGPTAGPADGGGLSKSSSTSK